MKNKTNCSGVTLLFIGLFLSFASSGVSGNENSFTDPRDDKTYKTVTIGNQVWMAENLAFKPDSGNYWMYCNSRSNLAKYGYLYDWQTARNVCPTGWHLPSDEEWTELTEYLGGESVAGGKLKATGTIKERTGLWHDPNTGASNETGFTALPGGGRYSNGRFGDVGDIGYWWSSIDAFPYGAGGRGMLYDYSLLHRNLGDKEFGFSVRCVRD